MVYIGHKWRRFWKMELFFTFFKIGLFTFGGGYAMIPLIQREVVESKQWITREEMLDIIAVAESTPGPLAVNMATFVGSRVSGTPGAAAATAGVVLPSFLIILILANVLEMIERLPVVRYAFAGIRAGVLALIINALLSLLGQGQRTIFSCLIILGAFISSAFFHVNTILVLLFCALAGFIYSSVKRGSKR